MLIVLSAPIVRCAARLFTGLCFLTLLGVGVFILPQPAAAQGGYYVPPSEFPSIPRNGQPSSNYRSPYPSDPQAAQEKDDEANRLLSTGHPQDAIPLLRQALYLDYRSANAYNDLGVAYMDLNQYSMAMPNLRQAIYYNPRLELAYRNLALIYDRDDAAAAAPWYTKALQLDPKDAKAWAWRGYDYDVIGAPAKAFYDYKMALRLNPRFADAYHWRGKLELEQGQDKAAYADLRKSRSLDPSEGVGIAKDIRTIITQRQERLAEQRAAQRQQRTAQSARRQFLAQRRQIASVIRQGPRYYTEIYSQARHEGDSPEEAARKEQEARDHYDRDVALQNAWENNDYATLNKIESGDMSREEISSYEPSNSEPTSNDNSENSSPQPENEPPPSEPMSEPAPEPAPEGGE